MPPMALVSPVPAMEAAPAECGNNAPPDGERQASGAWTDALVAMLRFHRIAVEPAQAAQAFGDVAPSSEDVVRYLRQTHLRARTVSVGVQRLAAVPLPAIAVYDDGSCILLAKAAADRVLILDPGTQRPKILPTADFAARWTGQLILVTRRASLGELGRRFDIAWFGGAIHKYRWILGEVLAASLFLQIFALLSPLFFQVAIDKLLVHRGMATLDILVGGLVCIALFEAVLTTLQNLRRVVRDAHRIIALDRGRNVEHGTHDDLLRIGGRFATLYSVQTCAA